MEQFSDLYLNGTGKNIILSANMILVKISAKMHDFPTENYIKTGLNASV